MDVLKRDGTVQTFDLDKIKSTLICTSNDIKQPLNESDLHNILNGIKKNIDNSFEAQISYKDIHNIVISNLEDIGFNNMARAYDEFETSFVNK